MLGYRIEWSKGQLGSGDSSNSIVHCNKSGDSLYASVVCDQFNSSYNCPHACMHAVTQQCMQ